jgi:hypothetical protein
LDVDFFFTTLTDGLSQAQEARVWACGDLRDKEGLGGFVHHCQARGLLGIVQSILQLCVVRHSTIYRGTNLRRGRQRQNSAICVATLADELIQQRSPNKICSQLSEIPKIKIWLITYLALSLAAQDRSSSGSL